MNMKKLLAALLAVVMLAAGAVAAISSVAVYVPVTGVTLSTPPGDLHVGDAFQLIATVQPLDATDQRVIWDSSNRAVATVDHLGDVRVHSIGTAVITATTLGGNFTATAAITVVPVELSSIALSHSNETIFPGQFLHLEAIFLPSNVTNRNVTWSSDNPDIAEVDWSGRVRGRAIGDAIITVTAANGMTASMNVTVAPIRVESVEFVLASTVFHVGTIRMIRVEITPFNATNRDITWSSSDTAVATVDDQGRVTAHSLGIATITATIDEQQFSINVDVQPILVADITLLPSDAEIVMDNTRQIHLSFAPHNAENANFVWSTSDSSIATVDSDGLVTAQGVGTAIITASTADGSVEATASITVLPILVQRVAVNPNALEVRHGQTREIRAFVSPPNATDQRLTWSSSDTAVATVDQEGRVTAHAAGTAIITVTAQDGSNAYATTTITVPTRLVNSIVPSRWEFSATIGDQFPLTVSVSPADACNPNYRVSVTDSRIISYENGVVTALAQGEAHIEFTALDGSGVSARTRIVVHSPILVERIRLPVVRLTLDVGDSTTLPTAVAIPSYATNSELAVTVSDPEILQYENGTLTRLAAGEAFVVFAATDGSGIYATIAVIETTTTTVTTTTVATTTTEATTTEATTTVATTEVTTTTTTTTPCEGNRTANVLGVIGIIVLVIINLFAIFGFVRILIKM